MKCNVMHCEIFLLWNVHFGARPRVPPRLLRGEAPRKRDPGGSKDARKTTPDSLFGDVPDLESRKVAEIAKDREKWKSLRPSKRC